MRQIAPRTLLLVSLILSAHSQSGEAPGAHHYLTDCLVLSEVQQLTQSAPTTASRLDKPQPGCSYNDNEIIAKQTRIIYSRDPGYTAAFNIEGLMQPVPGLGRFAEFEAEAGRLYVNLGRDGIVFEGRQGDTPMSLEQLSALAQAVLTAGNQ